MMCVLKLLCHAEHAVGVDISNEAVGAGGGATGEPVQRLNAACGPAASATITF